jgi:beta-lactamase superfamily II metal-dependent hydrolase
MTTVRVRMYHVGFGDCFLVTIGDADAARRILIDCGRHAGSRPPVGDEKDFKAVVTQLIDDIASECSPPRIDVVVATHRHRDHVHGFSYESLWKRVVVGEVWLPWVEDPDDPSASTIRTNQHNLALRTFHALRTLKAAGSQVGVDDAIEIAYNCTTNATAFKTLREGFHPKSKQRLRYLPRQGRRPEQLNQDDCGDVLPPGVTVHVLGPSRDPRVIKRLDPPDGKGYLQLLPVDDSVGADEVVPPSTAGSRGTVPSPFEKKWTVRSGEIRSRYGLTDRQLTEIRNIRAGAMGDALQLVYRIDNAVNGTSLVLLIQIGDVKLLFPGDAQWGTWEHILTDERSRELLRGTTLFKVGHHGSHNATPKEFIETFINEATKAAMIPVDTTKYKGEWQSIPKDTLLADLQKKGTRILRSDMPVLHGDDVTVSPDGLWTEIRLEG